MDPFVKKYADVKKVHIATVVVKIVFNFYRSHLSKTVDNTI